jgi:hypothetical protein
MKARPETQRNVPTNNSLLASHSVSMATERECWRSGDDAARQKHSNIAYVVTHIPFAIYALHLASPAALSKQNNSMQQEVHNKET